jgi:hypothetical protein
MPASSHARRVLARLALGLAALLAVAAAADLAARFGGTPAGVLVIGAVSGGCGLVHSLRSRREPRLTRPAPVRLPEPAADDLEPANALS